VADNVKKLPGDVSHLQRLIDEAVAALTTLIAAIDACAP